MLQETVKLMYHSVLIDCHAHFSGPVEFVFEAPPGTNGRKELGIDLEKLDYWLEQVNSDTF